MERISFCACTEASDTESVTTMAQVHYRERKMYNADLQKRKNGTWYVMARYTDWTEEQKQKCKRGFKTKREAQEWERTCEQQENAGMNMTFEAFIELYKKGYVGKAERKYLDHQGEQHQYKNSSLLRETKNQRLPPKV